VTATPVAVTAPAAEAEAHDRSAIGVWISAIAIRIAIAIVIIVIVIVIRIGINITAIIRPINIVATRIIMPPIVLPIGPVVIGAVTHLVDRLGNVLPLVEQGRQGRRGQRTRRRGEEASNGHCRRELQTTSLLNSLAFCQNDG
jgi:hypothetical protein